MEFTPGQSARIVAVALISMVATQIVYFALSSSGGTIDRPIIWTVEAIGFMAISVFALAALARSHRHAPAWAAMAAGGLLNVIQVGMGLAMFGPVSEAGEAMAPAFQSILAGAFFLYFAGKFLFGFAAASLGLALLRGGGRASKGIGALAILAGLAAMFVNIGAMAKGMELVFPAGATGTAATLLLALTIVAMERNSDRPGQGPGQGQP